jgi:hypothetical protein
MTTRKVSTTYASGYVSQREKVTAGKNIFIKGVKAL